MLERHNTELNKTQNHEVWVARAGCNRATKHTVVFSVDFTHEFEGGAITEEESFQIVRCP